MIYQNEGEVVQSANVESEIVPNSVLDPEPNLLAETQAHPLDLLLVLVRRRRFILLTTTVNTTSGDDHRFTAAQPLHGGHGSHAAEPAFGQFCTASLNLEARPAWPLFRDRSRHEKPRRHVRSQRCAAGRWEEGGIHRFQYAGEKAPRSQALRGASGFGEAYFNRI